MIEINYCNANIHQQHQNMVLWPWGRLIKSRTIYVFWQSCCRILQILLKIHAFRIVKNLCQFWTAISPRFRLLPELNVLRLVLSVTHRIWGFIFYHTRHTSLFNYHAYSPKSILVHLNQCLNERTPILFSFICTNLLSWTKWHRGIYYIKEIELITLNFSANMFYDRWNYFRFCFS